jgi:signal transduction histidine kinase/AmiR/NasT family two-component response regulator
MLNRGVAIREAESKSIRVIGSRVDITQRKLAEEKICSLNADMQSRIDEMITLLNILPTGVWIGNEDCSQITGNGAAYKMMGLNPGINVSVTNPQPEVPVGMRIFVNGEEVPPEDAPMQQVARTGKPSYNFEHELLFPDGTRKSIYGSAAPLFDQQGRVRKVIGAYADFTDRKRLEEALLRAKEAAEAANRSKDEFLANVSHEIRTPFGAILGMTELVLDTPLTDDQRQCLETVKSAADSLLGLVDDLLDFERIEAGKLELAPADFALRPMMADALRAQTVQARGKGLELVWKVEPDAPDALVGDAGRLRQVLLNLVGNAIKFTRHGEVAVRVGVAECPVPDEEAVLRFAVRDTGIGIPPDGRERIFRAFEQADSSTTREYGGTGLGLTIATRLVGLMGGTIAVESEPGKGSTFSFTARFGRPPHRPEQVVARRSDAPHVAAAPGPAVTPLRILVAEDSEFNVRHLQRLLGKKGHHVRLANNGREALALLGIEGRGSGIEGPLVPDIDVLLLDMHMPELDGFQVVRAIRERERAAGGHLSVIALTARSRPEDREKCLAAGMDDFLTKPIRAAELFATIERVASAFGGPGP